jgi:hypothetical protein
LGQKSTDDGVVVTSVVVVESGVRVVFLAGVGVPVRMGGGGFAYFAEGVVFVGGNDAPCGVGELLGAALLVLVVVFGAAGGASGVAPALE